jgi:SAM-dependent methyltransferase
MSILNDFVRATGRFAIDNYRSLVYQGDQVDCWICGWKGKRFFEHAKCPRCRSMARTRLIPYALRHFDLNLSGSSVFHVAPNYPEYSYISRKANPLVYDRLDINSSIKYINMVGDLNELKIEDETYDLAIIWHVMEHIPKDVEALREVYRILKPSGRVLLSVPIFPIDSPTTFEDPAIPRSDFERIHGHDDHCRSCGLDYWQHIVQAGFSVETLNVGRDVERETIDRLGLYDKHVCWLGSKN